MRRYSTWTALALLGEGRERTAGRRLAKARDLYQRIGDGLELPEGAVEVGTRLERIDELLAGSG